LIPIVIEKIVRRRTERRLISRQIHAPQQPVQILPPIHCYAALLTPLEVEAR
jgi:hypothetical protein